MSVGSVEVLKAGGHQPMGCRLGPGNRSWESRVASPVGSSWEHKVCLLLCWEML